MGAASVQILQRPFLRAAFVLSLPAGFTAEEISVALDRFSLAQSVGLLGGSLAIVGKVLLLGALLYLGVLVLTGTARFRDALSLVSTAMLTTLFGSWFVLLVLTIRTPAAIRAMADLQPAIGLSLFFPNASLLVFTLLNDINLFDLWFMSVLARGLSSQGILRPRGALCVSFGVWAFCVAAQISFLAVVSPPT